MSIVKLSNLIRHEEELPLWERFSSRIVKVASEFDYESYVGWQMNVPKNGIVDMYLFGGKSVSTADLEWLVEETADSVEYDNEFLDFSNDYLYEIILPISLPKENVATTGFSMDSNIVNNSRIVSSFVFDNWVFTDGNQFGELVEALKVDGASLKVTIGSTSETERKKFIEHLNLTWDPNSPIPVSNYCGTPVRQKVLLTLPNENVSARIRALVSACIPGAVIKRAVTKNLGATNDVNNKDLWNNPLDKAIVLPELAARLMVFEPRVGRDPVIGIETREPDVKQLPARHKNSESKGVCIGKAINNSGTTQDILIPNLDLTKHYQIVGKTGSGKSTLLVNSILDVIKKGNGVTFFDPHGETIDRILERVPCEHKDRIRVIRVGDENNPVPMNIWNSDNPEDCEQLISDISLLFKDVYDPKDNGWVGPRWIRWFGIFAFATIALLGRNASFQSIVAFSSTEEKMRQLADAIKDRYPEHATRIISEFANMGKQNDFADFINWYICKFQDLLSVKQTRNTLGATANALDFDKHIDDDTVTLIDLASFVIGKNSSRIMGTLILHQLWEAITKRKHRDKIHFVFIDEVELFQTNPLPQMLAESRKLGISLVLSHQNLGQLSDDVSESIQSNTMSISSFALSTKDSHIIAERFDNQELQKSLTRLNVFNAITTISVDGKQTPEFTLTVDYTDPLPDGVKTREIIEIASIEKLVEPF
jgi:hypothetical protein